MINRAVRLSNACTIRSYSNLDSFKVHGIHHCTLKKLDGGVVTFQETLQLKVGLFSESVVASYITHRHHQW